MIDLKQIFCDTDSPLGKLTEWAATAIKTTVIEIDVRDMDTLEIACPCCTFWRGVLIGAVVFGLLGLLIGVCV